MIYFCCEDNRRRLVRQHLVLNGIDYLEVVDREEPVQAERQRTLRIFFVKEPTADLLSGLKTITVANVRITGGVRTTGIVATQVQYDDTSGSLEVAVNQRGDFSTYTLYLVAPVTGETLPGLDPQLASVDFSFKVECPSDLDCRQVNVCPPKVHVEPELDYLAKDYTSFRQLILDRLALIAPGWRERTPADLGMTWVELLAYVGDYLSYRQDAIATEAYLGTARQRVSIRRHARLLDYPMHEGCNARVWVQVRLNGKAPDGGVVLPRNSALLELDPKKLASGTCFSTDAGVDCVLAGDATKLKQILDARTPDVFEPLHDVFLHPTHHDMKFYMWGEGRCCLPKGAVKAALAGHYPFLAPGQVLVLHEVCGPHTGDPADADPAKAHAVRLTGVNGMAADDYAAKRKVQKDKGKGLDTILPRLNDPVTGEDYTEIEWHPDDALPFPLCLSTVDENGKPLSDVSLAQGNIVLADHGRTLIPSDADHLEPEPKSNPALAPVIEANCGCGDDESPREAPARFRPLLNCSGLTHAQALPQDFESSPAARVTVQDPREALPAIRLTVKGGGDLWEPQRDLIGSDATAREFVAEIENDGRARIRFGDDVNGMRPAKGTVFYPRYRIGNGARGNVGAGAITQIFAPEFLDPQAYPKERSVLSGVNASIDRVTNPLPAWGGTEPESMEEVRQYAPQAFKVPRRCVTPEDYARRTGEHPRVQRAAATIRWTGSWHTIFLSVDPRGGGGLTGDLEKELLDWLEPYRLAGHDLEINGPIYVSLELSLLICVADGYFRSDVKAALLDAFSSRQRPDGSLGFFHPDRFTFGGPVEVSAIYATAQRLAGVRYVELVKLRRQGAESGPDVPDGGAFTPDRLEVVRLENDPSFPDHGQLNLDLQGGR